MELIAALSTITWPGAIALAFICLAAVGIVWAWCWMLTRA